MNVLVKICGIRTLAAAEAAAASGADYLGFNFVPSSKRRIDPDTATGIIEKIREGSGIKIVGVFQDAPAEAVESLAKRLHLDLVQLHGHENADFMSHMPVPVIKSFTLADSAENIPVPYLLLDRAERGEGALVDQEKAAELAQRSALFLAGGLTPENVAEAVRRVHPFAVDVAGGVETSGIQDILKIRAFVANAKSA